MNTTAPTWKCPRCGTIAPGGGQRFCRQCGHQHYGPLEDPDAPAPRPPLRPVSRLLIAVIVVLFALLGGLAALVLDDIRGDSSDQPPPSTNAEMLVEAIGRRSPHAGITSPPAADSCCPRPKPTLASSKSIA